MHPFFRIINLAYSEEEIAALNCWADELMKDLDSYVASGLQWDEDNDNHSVKVQDMEWDFPEPPEILL